MKRRKKERRKDGKKRDGGELGWIEGRKVERMRIGRMERRKHKIPRTIVFLNWLLN